MTLRVQQFRTQLRVRAGDAPCVATAIMLVRRAPRYKAGANGCDGATARDLAAFRARALLVSNGSTGAALGGGDDVIREQAVQRAVVVAFAR